MMNTTHFAMGLLLATLTGCAAKPAAVEEEQHTEANDALVTIVLFDSATLGPVADALVCTDAYACETTGHWGTAHLPRSDEDVELTYMAPDYRVHRTFIAADVWGSDRAGYFLPAVKAADVDAALEAVGGAEDEDAGAVLTPVRQTIHTNLEPENDGPVVAVGNWELFSNVPTGSTAIVFDHEAQDCQGELTANDAGTTSVDVTAGMVTVVPTLHCEPR